MNAQAWIYVVIGFALVVAAAPYGFARSDTARRKAVDRLAKRIDLAVPTSPIEDERVGLRLAVRERCIAVGGGIGLVAAILAALFLPGFDQNNFSLLGIFILSLTGIGVGAGISALRTTRELPNDVPRIARLSSPTMGDYLIGLEYRGAIVMDVVGAAVTAVTLPLGFAFAELTWDRATLPVVVAILSIAALIGVLAVSRSILDRGQRAASVQELAWDDAIRSTALRDLITVPLALGFASAFVPLVTVVSGTRIVQPTSSADNLLSLGALALIAFLALCGIVVAVIVLASSPQRHYRRRLWPTPAGNTTAPVGDAANAATTTVADRSTATEGDVR